MRSRLIIEVWDGIDDFKITWDQKPKYAKLMQCAMSQAYNEVAHFIEHGFTSKLVEKNVKPKKVTRDEALKHYLQVGQVLQKRIQAINESDERAVFTIEDHLADNI